MENLGEAPVAKPGYSSGLVCKESGKPQVAGSNPARGSIAKKRFHEQTLRVFLIVRKLSHWMKSHF